MDLHEFIASAQAAGYIRTVDDEVDPHLELARQAAGRDGEAMLYRTVRGSRFPVIVGACSDRRYFGLALDTPPDRLIFRLADALARPEEAPVLLAGRCQEIVEPQADLTSLPFLTH